MPCITAARRELRRAVAHGARATRSPPAAAGSRAIDGNLVIELVPGRIGKGGAIAALAAEAPLPRAASPVFVGDDATDEDGFAAVDALGGIVGQGRRRPARRPQFRLPDVAAVWTWIGANG